MSGSRRMGYRDYDDGEGRAGLAGHVHCQLLLHRHHFHHHRIRCAILQPLPPGPPRGSCPASATTITAAMAVASRHPRPPPSRRSTNQNTIEFGSRRGSMTLPRTHADPPPLPIPISAYCDLMNSPRSNSVLVHRGLPPLPTGPSVYRRHMCRALSSFPRTRKSADE